MTRSLLGPIAMVWTLAACGGDSAKGIELAQLSDAELSRLADAALGFDVVGAEGNVTSLADDDPCPSRAIDGAANTLTVTGGCTRANGVMVLGSAVITNSAVIIDGLTYDATANTIDELAHFGLRSDAIDLLYDGRVETTPTDDVSFVLDVTKGGLAVHSDLAETCGGDGCTITGTIEYGAAGAATVTGTIPHNGDDEGHVTAVGTDTLKVDWVNGCTWELVNAERSGACGTAGL
jgi:hypothetical protein